MFKKESKPEYIQRVTSELILQGKSKEEALSEAYSKFKETKNLDQKDFTYINKIMKKMK